MKLTIVPVTPFQQNCSILVDEATQRAVVIDPGGDLDRIDRRRHLLAAEPDLHEARSLAAPARRCAPAMPTLALLKPPPPPPPSPSSSSLRPPPLDRDDQPDSKEPPLRASLPPLPTLSESKPTSSRRRRTRARRSTTHKA